jgi:hypothetical protein
LNSNQPLRYGDIDHQYNTFKNGSIKSIQDKKELKKEEDKIIKDFYPFVGNFHLNPKEEIRFYYNWKGKWFWNSFADEPPLYSNGLLISQLNSDRLSDGIIMINLPYPILGAHIEGLELCRWANDIAISVAKLDDWFNASEYCKNNIIDFSNLFPVGDNANIIDKYFIKLPQNLLDKKMVIFTQFQIAPNAIPKLISGKNTLQLKNTDKEKLEVKFTFKKN